MLTIRRDLVLPASEYWDGLQKAEAFHGHLCPGMFSGVKMSLLAKGLLGMKEFPSKDLIVIAEIDRCLTDAIMSFTGCRLGRRSMKFRDFGKFAATFCSLEHRQGFRIATRADSFDRIEERMKAAGIDPRGHHQEREKAGQVFFEFPWQEHFAVTVVDQTWDDTDLPGFPKIKVQCSRCQEPVMDGRHLTRDGQIFCRPCAPNP